MVFHGSLSDSKSPQVSRTLLSILAVLSNVVVWVVSTRPLISKFSSPFNNPLVTVPSAPIIIGIIVSFIVQSFFNSLERLRSLSFFSHSFNFILWSAGTVKSTILQVLFFFYYICDEIHDFVRYFFTFTDILLSRFAWKDHNQSMPRLHFSLRFAILRMCWLVYRRSSVPLVLLRHPFCSSGNSPRHARE